MPVTEVFVSYRADDSVHAAMAISDRLARHFGRGCVFRDQDSLSLGSLYPGHIRRAARRCDVMLAVIGPHWLDARDAWGGRRIDDPRDWVRWELRIAFQRGIPVVPILLDDTALPGRDQLPADISLLSVSNYWRIRHQSLDADVVGLITRLDGKPPEQVPRSDGAPHQGYRQDNVATDGGTVYASQHGPQIINVGDRDGKRS